MGVYMAREGLVQLDDASNQMEMTWGTYTWGN